MYELFRAKGSHERLCQLLCELLFGNNGIEKQRYLGKKTTDLSRK